MNECRWWMSKRRKVDIPSCLAARTLDLEPWKAAIQRLIDRWRRIDRFSIRPHAFIPTFAGQLVRLANERFAFCPKFHGPSGEHSRHCARFAEFLCQSFAIAS
jgi:hypothetical protein